MKHLLLTTIASVVLLGCGKSQPPKPTTTKAPDITIHKTATLGNIDAINQHLSSGTDVNTKDVLHRTPLHLATEAGNKEIVELLIAKGADVNTNDKRGRTPLFGAAALGRKEIAGLLIAKVADVNAKDKVGDTPLD